MLQKLKDDALQARKARDTVRATLLTTVLSDVNVRAKNDGNREPTDQDAIKVVDRFVKQLNQAIDARPDAQLIVERDILMAYVELVQACSAVDYDEVIGKVVAENTDKWEVVKANPKNLGWFLGQVMKATGGKANPAVVNQKLAEALTQ